MKNQKLIRLILFVGSLLLFGFAPVNVQRPEFDRTLHVIVVYDESVTADDSGKAIGSVRDQQIIAREIPIIARQAKMRYRIKSFKQKTDSPRDLKNYLSNYHVKTNDVLWFIYSGHGQNYGSGPDKRWPLFAWGGNSFSLTNMRQILGGLNARLTMIFYDTCNGISPLRNTGLLSPGPAPRTDVYPLAYSLLRKSGDLIATSAKRGQFANGNSQNGGIFLSTFFELFADPGSSYSDWDKLMNKTAAKTSRRASEIPRVQNPDGRS